MIKIKNRTHLYTILLVFLLIVTLMLSVKVTKRAADSVIEGDASAELVLAHRLSETNQLLSDDWYYSTELQVFLQLIFAPLFKVFSDWTKVRFIGTLILQLLLAASFIFMMRRAGRSLNAILLGTSMILLPYCVTYGRMVLYQVMYLPNVAVSFTVTGLMFSVIRSYREKRRTKIIVTLLILFLFSFLVSLTGVRFLAEVFFPILFVCVILALIRDSFVIGKDSRESVLFYVSLAGAVLAGLAGFLVNKTVLGEKYFIAGTSSDHLTVRTYFDTSIWKCVLHQFGYRTDVRLFSLTGIFSLCGLAVCFYCIFRSLRSFRQDASADVIRALPMNLLPVCLFCAFMELCLITNLEINTRYFLTSSVWLIPLLCFDFDEVYQKKWSSPGKWMTFFIIAVVFINGVINMAFFLNPDGFAKQPYEGMPYTNPKLVGDMKGALRFLRANDYEYGYATYWEASTITEKTNGMPVSLVTFGTDKLTLRPWLTFRSYRDIPADKVFLMLDVTNAQYFPDFDVPFKWSEVYRDTRYVIYDIPEPDQIRNYLLKGRKK